MKRGKDSQYSRRESQDSRRRENISHCDQRNYLWLSTDARTDCWSTAAAVEGGQLFIRLPPDSRAWLQEYSNATQTCGRHGTAMSAAVHVSTLEARSIVVLGKQSQSFTRATDQVQIDHVQIDKLDNFNPNLPFSDDLQDLCTVHIRPR